MHGGAPHWTNDLAHLAPGLLGLFWDEGGRDGQASTSTTQPGRPRRCGPPRAQGPRRRRFGQNASVTDSPELVRQLLKAVVAYTRFFDTCDDSVLDDDTAIKQTEYAAYLLDQLADTDRQRLVEELSTLAALETHPSDREYLKRFAYSVGLVDEEGQLT